ncbi:LacI family DNA-binding transcriptional regulator [Phototrophicus methaneseepsis]|uniref:LacI family DNA-binding transcriptional regulator n=1 Tax=Phototrophicus methaneseepsis TaxID=2710758 RepID=A0A7S8IFR1_9CHLR|nr:LacI family DNA-binding transcriptional regulator [Phototrophicus methaneseepsis]QPC83744.1 LacI family DNA-binding transcriptional regulator [Phototrophicus methaneseepsis]
MPVTIRQISEAAGVSVATVSRALNGSDHPVNAETQKRILEIAQKLGYHPNHIARSLRTDRSPIIGIICDDITSAFTTKIVRGVQDRLKEDGYFCVVINTDWDPASEQRAIQDLTGYLIEGIIFAETVHQSASDELKLNDKKCVFVHRLFPKGFPNSVIPDELYGSRLAVNHLIQLGHKRIGYLNGPEQFYSSEERFLGYKTMLEDSGIAFDPTLVANGDFGTEQGYVAASQLLDLPEPPTAIFAANDLMAIGTIYAAQDRGLRIPDDLALVGYDNQYISTISRPSLTTVSLPCFEMGRASAELLLALLNDEAADSQEIKVKGELLIRESCGAARDPQPAPRMPSRVDRLNLFRDQNNGKG